MTLQNSPRNVQFYCASSQNTSLLHRSSLQLTSTRADAHELRERKRKGLVQKFSLNVFRRVKGKRGFSYKSRKAELLLQHGQLKYILQGIGI